MGAITQAGRATYLLQYLLWSYWHHIRRYDRSEHKKEGSCDGNEQHPERKLIEAERLGATQTDWQTSVARHSSHSGLWVPETPVSGAPQSFTHLSSYHGTLCRREELPCCIMSTVRCAFTGRQSSGRVIIINGGDVDDRTGILTKRLPVSQNKRSTEC